MVLALAVCPNFSSAATPANPPTSATEPAATAYWGAWTADNNPSVLGTKVVKDLLTRNLASTNYVQRGGMSYPEVCVAYGSLRFVGTTKDKDLLDKLTKRYEVFFTPEGQSFIPKANSVDNGVFGILPMEVYRQNGEKPADKRWLDLGKLSADTEWANPTPEGLTRLSRFWVDDMFMVTALQAQAYRVTKDKVYLDRDATEVVAYLKALQQPNGLFFHAADSPYCWGRGNGWFAAGLAEILSIMPADHPQRPAVLDGYKKMMAGLLKYQAADGMWRELIDIDNDQNWGESSGTGMFVFSMATGVRNGWLDETSYKEPVKKAWTALATHISPEGKVRDVCVGTNKAAQTIRTGPGPEMLQYYLARPKNVGDFHGQAAFIWAAWAMAMDPKPNP
jgi:rhamnogalacturonyl hydrolase YesR